ncbi:hypothetical protein ES703_06904 [subsurface metagenome]
MIDRRTSLMVAYDILLVAVGGSNKTNLVYKCNLNFKIIKKWLARLMSKRLLEFNSLPSKIWTTTPKGLRFMLAMDRVLVEWDDGLINLDTMKQEVVVDGN